MTAKMPPLAVTIPEAAALVRVSVEKLRQHIDRNELEASYIDSKPVIRIDELDRWLKARPNERPLQSRRAS